MKPGKKMWLGCFALESGKIIDNSEFNKPGQVLFKLKKESPIVGIREKDLYETKNDAIDAIISRLKKMKR